MNITNNIELLLFYEKAAGEKVHFTVRWKKKKEIFEGMTFIGYGPPEIRESGNFTTRSGAEGFVNDLVHIKSFTGWFEIIEYK